MYLYPSSYDISRFIDIPIFGEAVVQEVNDYWPLEEKTLIGKEAVSDNNVIGRHTSPASVTMKGDVRYE